MMSNEKLITPTDVANHLQVNERTVIADQPTGYPIRGRLDAEPKQPRLTNMLTKSIVMSVLLTGFAFGPYTGGRRVQPPARFSGEARSGAFAPAPAPG